ncbi:lipocalin family protein [Sinomicrobium weinanense]|uniref:Lipocalin family protein n=1 Tax=Sinomicrobium weinanense TaxID=2842200 RepID=A0A926JSM9_9FLAO|nr:lipocalin family protein [Sinomicrobium weinanense]MBC9796651.1 lipocalin family protein [Sinomicrobium weinanense]MBU3124900.1 lipocalin family protein [Sinomicrobium weinanense]
MKAPKPIIFLLTFALLLSCGSDNGPEKAMPASEELIVGHWTLNEYIDNGTPKPLTDCNKKSFFEFKADGSIHAIFYEGSPCTFDSESTGEYSLPDDTTLFVTSGGNSANHTIVSLTETDLKLLYSSGVQLNFLREPAGNPVN